VSFEAMRYQVSFGNASRPLSGDLVIPAGMGPHPVAVLVSGTSGPRDQGRWVQALAQYGLATLSWDSPGWGSSPGALHWQAPDERTMEVVAAMDFLQGVRDVSPDGVALIGSDSGGWAAALGAVLSSRVSALVLIAPPCTGAMNQEVHRLGQRLHGRGFSPAETALAQLVLTERIRRLMEGDDAAAVLRTEAPCWHAPWYGCLPGVTTAELEAFATLADFHPAAALPSIDCPLLGVFGEDDPATPGWANAHLLSEMLGLTHGRDRQILVLPRTDDAFIAADSGGWRPPMPPGDWHPDVAAAVCSWLAPRLSPHRWTQDVVVVPRAG
jgi:uncharacterized protein